MKLALILIIILSVIMGQVHASNMHEDGSMSIGFCYVSCDIVNHNGVSYHSDSGWVMFDSGYVRWAGCVVPELGCS